MSDYIHEDAPQDYTGIIASQHCMSQWDEKGFAFIKVDQPIEGKNHRAFLHVSKCEFVKDDLEPGIGLVFNLKPSTKRPGTYEAVNVRIANNL